MHSSRTALLVALVVCALPAAAQPPRGMAGARQVPRGMAIDERLAADAGLRLGDRVVLSARPGAAAGGDTVPLDTAVVDALVRRAADPSEVARAEYRVRLHLTQLQRLTGAEERVDRFAVATRDPAATDSALRAINAAAFGFRAHRSADVAAGTSRTFEVVRRFHRAIAVITVVASAAFLLCILLLKVDERRRDVAALRLMGISRRTVVLSVVLEAAAVALLGSAVGTGIGWAATRVINWHYQGVYRTPLAFAALTPGTIAFAVVLSVLLGIVAGFVAAARLASTPPLRLFGR
jgi:putative ABC transport system permease protein